MTAEQVKQQQMLEEIAECKVKVKLLSSDIITAKPVVDVEGADLLAIMRVQDGAKFARIQCKGRTLKTSLSRSSIKIKKSYVTGTFTCLLYLVCLYDKTEHLLCFFAHDIKDRKDLWILKDNIYSLSLYGKSFKEKYDLFDFNNDRVRALKDMIEASDIGKEFRYGFGKGKITLPPIRVSGTGSRR